MGHEDINMKAKEYSVQAINEYLADEAKGKLQGRLVIEEKGKNSRIVYQKFSGSKQTPEEMDTDNLEKIKAFCAKHHIESKLDQSPSSHVFRESRLNWEKEPFIIEMKRNNEITDALLEPGRLKKLQPPLRIEELQKLVENLPYNEICKSIDAFKNQTSLDNHQKNILQVLNKREMDLAIEAVKEYNKATKREITPNIMKSTDSPLSNIGAREMLNWGFNNKKTVLVQSMMRRISKAEAKNIKDNMLVDNTDQSFWIM